MWLQSLFGDLTGKLNIFDGTMNFKAIPDRTSSNVFKWYTVITCGLTLVMVGVVVVPNLFIRQTEVVVISWIDAARECRSYKSRKFEDVWPQYRSSVPERSFTYCGMIMSDHGSFDLPETSWARLVGNSREVLFDTLHVGCAYKVVVSGPGIALEKGGAASNRPRTLRKAEPLGDCDVPTRS